jgi:iron complex outermembrane receptor protein
MPMTLLRLCSNLSGPALALGLLPSLAGAQASADPAQLGPVVVTATRTEASPFDVPASIDWVGGAAIRDAHPQVDISESLGGVPGLLARDRQNYAQDVQISVRGFGARATFGIRGVRLYVDGVPATLPDGQGQISHVDLGSVDHIEVLRGPFSALYGNSSGGVIQVFTEEGRGPPTLTTSLTGGSYGALRLGVKASGASGALGYLVSASTFSTDGYRDHSSADRTIGNAKLSWKPDDSSTLTLVANSLALPQAQDPLGLTRAQFEADPRSVDPVALQFDTRKSVEQTQVGVIYERRLNEVHALRVLVYGGHRGIEQFLAIPPGPQANPLHSGGVVELGRDYSGVDLRWSAKSQLDGRPFTLIAGLAHDRLGEDRQGYENFVGSTLGVQGALRRDEHNTVTNLDPYVQGSWQFAERWTLTAGLRRSQVRFSSDDHYITAKNPDDSGSLRFSATLPVAGVVYALAEDVHLYATAGRGFETPTLNELAYLPSGASGLNSSLQAARSDSYEAGLKARSPRWGHFEVALFETRTDHEIVTETNVGGRSTFKNAGATRRRGVELQWSRETLRNLRTQVAYTYLDARYRDAFTTCTGTPCSTPNLTVPAGNRIPGIAASALYAALDWAPPRGWRAGVEGRVLGRVYVNDANSDAASGFAVAAAHVGYVARFDAWELAAYGRVDNLFDRRYAGSVIVNEGNARYFEPAPGRNWSAGVTAKIAF